MHAQSQNTHKLIDLLRWQPITTCLFLSSSQIPLRVNKTSNNEKCHLSSPKEGQKQFDSEHGKCSQHGAIHQAKFSKTASGRKI